MSQALSAKHDVWRAILERSGVDIANDYAGHVPVLSCSKRDQETLEIARSIYGELEARSFVGNEQQQTQQKVKFIESKAGEWGRRLNSNPNCSVFDLGKLRKIWRVTHGNPYDIGKDEMMDEEENKRRNESIHKENWFLLSGVLNILDSLMPTTLAPTTYPLPTKIGQLNDIPPNKKAHSSSSSRK
ncbi:MAG: hypothetical protein FJX34_01875 [Alphaproteobacteria bacterium]|nr:hypothetical protein [Alphaproteobacteria bacterium]